MWHPYTQALCNLAINYGHISGQSQLSDQAISIRSSAEWGKRLSIVKVSFTEAFRGGLEEKKRVAEALYRNRKVDIDTVLQYCRYVLTIMRLLNSRIGSGGYFLSCPKIRRLLVKFKANFLPKRCLI